MMLMKGPRLPDYSPPLQPRLRERVFADGKTQAWDQNLPSGTHVSPPTTSHHHMRPHSTTWDGLIQFLASFILPGRGPEASYQGLPLPSRSPAQVWPAPKHCHMIA